MAEGTPPDGARCLLFTICKIFVVLYREVLYTFYIRVQPCPVPTRGRGRKCIT